MNSHSPEDPETRQVAAWLRHLAREDHPRLPAAGQVWWRASISRRLIEQEGAVQHAARPALWGQAVGLAIAMSVVLLAASTGLMMGEHPDAGSEVFALSLVTVVMLPVVPVAGLIVMVFRRG